MDGRHNDPILETERLILRYQTLADIAFLCDLWSNPQVTRFIGGPRDRDRLNTEFEKTARRPTEHTYDLWVLEEKRSGHAVGHCGYVDKEIDGVVEIDLTYIIDPRVWRNGYATEIATALKAYAFSHFSIDRLVALIHPDNIASAKVAVAVGMRKLKTVERPGGVLRDVFVVHADR